MQENQPSLTEMKESLTDLSLEGLLSLRRETDIRIGELEELREPIDNTLEEAQSKMSLSERFHLLTYKDLGQLFVAARDERNVQTLKLLAIECSKREEEEMESRGGWDGISLEFGALALSCQMAIDSIEGGANG